MVDKESRSLDSMDLYGFAIDLLYAKVYWFSRFFDASSITFSLCVL